MGSKHLCGRICSLTDAQGPAECCLWSPCFCFTYAIKKVHNKRQKKKYSKILIEVLEILSNKRISQNALKINFNFNYPSVSAKMAVYLKVVHNE